MRHYTKTVRKKDFKSRVIVTLFTWYFTWGGPATIERLRDLMKYKEKKTMQQVATAERKKCNTIVTLWHVMIIYDGRNFSLQLRGIESNIKECTWFDLVSRRSDLDLCRPVNGATGQILKLDGCEILIICSKRNEILQHYYPQLFRPLPLWK